MSFIFQISPIKYSKYSLDVYPQRKKTIWLVICIYIYITITAPFLLLKSSIFKTIDPIVSTCPPHLHSRQVPAATHGPASLGKLSWELRLSAWENPSFPLKCSHVLGVTPFTSGQFQIWLAQQLKCWSSQWKVSSFGPMFFGNTIKCRWLKNPHVHSISPWTWPEIGREITITTGQPLLTPCWASSGSSSSSWDDDVMITRDDDFTMIVMR